ncbi:MAG: type I glyceraldehyde-3-phosphate dehydrogenase [Pseudomonadota bacterium]
MSKKTKIAINGFGRIGRMVVRAMRGRDDIELVGINDLIPIPTMAHLLKYDTTHGHFPGSISVKDNAIVIDGKEIPVTSEKDPEKLPWGKLGVDVVMECTGVFRDQAGTSKHLKAGAKKVIISAPAIDPDGTFVMGVNHTTYDNAKHNIVSNASCTTNCLAPFAKVLNETFGIESGLMTTIHAYTNDQCVVDAPHKDLRRARAAAMSQIPTTTGAAKAVGLVLPDLNGKLDGFAIRVPTINVSCVDLTALCKKPVNAKDVNAAFKKASENELKGILGYTEEPLVSTDFNGDPRSSIVDGLLTKANGNLVKVIAWYDNEMGFSYRMVEFAIYMGERL